jgi:16S rRNA (guanine527-N7)-methyltransferase
MISISQDQAAGALHPYGVVLDSYLYEKIASYIKVMMQWNQKISLTTVTEPSEILKFHFGESLFAASAVNIQNGRLADVGSGAGFPGLALAMANPLLEVTLIDSNAKKAVFLSEVTRRMGLNNVKVIRSRMEEFFPGPSTFDLVTSRAFGQFDELLAWSKSVISDRGNLALWVGDTDAKVIAKKSGWDWQEPRRIPKSEQRYVLVGTPRD